MGMAGLAALLVMRVGQHARVPSKAWSMFPLQHALRLRGMTNQVEHKMQVKMAKACKALHDSCYGDKVSILSMLGLSLYHPTMPPGPSPFRARTRNRPRLPCQPICAPYVMHWDSSTPHSRGLCDPFLRNGVAARDEGARPPGL
jgi:hypothetical protein